MTISATARQTSKERVLAAFKEYGWRNLRPHYLLSDFNQYTGCMKVVPFESFVAEGDYRGHGPVTLEVSFFESGAFRGREIRCPGVNFGKHATTVSGVLAAIRDYGPTSAKAREKAAQERFRREAAERAARRAAAQVEADAAFADLLKWLNQMTGRSLQKDAAVTCLEMAERVFVARHRARRA